jgi:hypothetical protein
MHRVTWQFIASRDVAMCGRQYGEGAFGTVYRGTLLNIPVVWRSYRTAPSSVVCFSLMT